jgi:photosystem II stability/assembly factor-like uncharacterized protein
MTRIFLSYRRDDTAAISGRVYDRLVARFGRRNVFKDIDSIPLGVDFQRHTETVIRSCDGVIALIGRDWVTIRDAQGHRRLDDPQDFVRLEIETALAAEIPVIPLLVDGAKMPVAADLPPSLAALTLRNGLELEVGRRFDDDMRRLLIAIESWGQSSRPRLWGSRRAAPPQGSTADQPARVESRARPQTTAPMAPERAHPPVAAKQSPARPGSEITRTGAPRVRRLWIALPAAFLLVALSLTLIASPASPLRTLALGGKPTATRTATTSLAVATHATLYGIFMTSGGREGWAVGTSDKLFHYTINAGWKPIATPLGKSLTLRGISMRPDGSEGWAVGDRGTLLHYRGNQWQDMTATDALTANLNAVQMLAPDDVWIVGDNGFITHYAGNTWRQAPKLTEDNLGAIAMVSPTAGWACGSTGFALTGNQFSVLRYTDGQWAVEHYSDYSMPITASCYALAMTSAAGGWISTIQGTQRFLNGWPIANADKAVLRAMSFWSPSEGAAVNGAQIYQFHDNAWKQVASVTAGALSSITMISDHEAWAVGENGLITQITYGLYGPFSAYIVPFAV